MLKNNNFLINTYNNTPDYWNTKPPLSFWSIALGYSLFGNTPLGLRFFSALSACLTLFLILLFCVRKYGPGSAFYTGLILISMPHFFLRHNARTGDADAIFLLFHTAGILAVLAWPKRYPAYCAASFLAGLAFLTKSFHAAPLVLLLIIFFFHGVSLIAPFGGARPVMPADWRCACGDMGDHAFPVRRAYVFHPYDFL